MKFFSWCTNKLNKEIEQKEFMMKDYRVICDDGTYYIGEVVYKEGKPIMYSERMPLISKAGPEELKSVMQDMMSAFDKKIFDTKEVS